MFDLPFMLRPFYVHTSRNRFGEVLTACGLTIRNALDPSKQDLATFPSQGYTRNTDPALQREANTACQAMNDQYASEMMAGLI